MKKNYFLFVLFLIFGLPFNSLKGQTHSAIAMDDVASIPNGTATTVVIQDVLANDMVDGLPATLSNAYFVGVSNTNNYLSLDETTGSVLFSNGPAPIGSYSLTYSVDATGQSCCESYATVRVNIGCDVINTPVIANLIEATCSTPTATLTLDGLPAVGAWQISDNGSLIASGTGTTKTLTNLYPGRHEFTVRNYQGCVSLSSLIVDLRYLNVTLTGNYIDSNADGIPSVGDAILYNCSVTNESNCNITNVTTLGGNLTLGGPIALLAAGVTDNTTLVGSYNITQTDINAGYVSKFTTIKGTAGSISQYTNVAVSKINYFNQTDGMKLVAFIDENGNGIQDPSEANFRYGEFTYEVNNNGTIHNVAATFSCYLYETNPTTSYDIGFHVYPSYAGYYGIVTPTINDITVANGSGLTTYYFPLTIIPYTDLSIVMYSYGAPPRPGFVYTDAIQIKNSGNQIIPAGTATFTKNNVVTITAIPAGAVGTANGFTYDFTALSPGEYRTIYVTMQVPTIPTVAMGDLLTNTASVTIPSGDVDIANNAASFTQAIVASWDPNIKSEGHGGRVLFSGFTADDYLTYTIEFENTGTANAEFIHVNDVLDVKLDETSVKMIDASHQYVLDRVGNHLSWFFDDIQLPPSVDNTNIGHGYVVFQVKPKPGFALGDVIPNTADIIFDFNPAIVTNTATTTFVNNLATSGFAFEGFKSYPNPVKNLLYISNASEMDSMTVTSVLGQTVLTKNINALETTVDLSQLPKGVYFVKVTANNQENIIKIIKE